MTWGLKASFTVPFCVMSPSSSAGTWRFLPFLHVFKSGLSKNNPPATPLEPSNVPYVPRKKCFQSPQSCHLLLCPRRGLRAPPCHCHRCCPRTPGKAPAGEFPVFHSHRVFVGFFVFSSLLFFLHSRNSLTSLPSPIGHSYSCGELPDRLSPFAVGNWLCSGEEKQIDCPCDSPPSSPFPTAPLSLPPLPPPFSPPPSFSPPPNPLARGSPGGAGNG